MADYFVKVDDGQDLRRNLLISSKESIFVLKQQQEISKVRARKRALIEQARRDLKELTFLFGELEQMMQLLKKKELQELAQPKPVTPKVKAEKKDVESQEKTVEKAAEVKEKTTNTVQQRELSQLERLEQSLSMIENRLSKL